MFHVEHPLEAQYADWLGSGIPHVQARLKQFSPLIEPNDPSHTSPHTILLVGLADQV
jgi:hypothetical protein